MIFFYIVSCALLIATVRAQSSTSSPSLDDPFDYYDNSDENRQAEDHRVVEPPLPPTFISKPEKIVVKDGENVTLHCKAADADQYTFMWRRGSETISLGKYVYNPSLYKLLEDNSLFIKNVKPLLTGQYSCEIQVSNDLKPTLTHQLKLEDDVEILSLEAANNATQLYPGDDLSLTCEAEGNPLPTIKWYFEGDGHSGLIEVQNNKVQTSQRSDVLLIEKVDIKNNGTYQCIAENDKSYDKKSIVIEVFDIICLKIRKVYNDKKLSSLECSVKQSKSQVNSLFWRSENNFNLENFKDTQNNCVKLVFYDINAFISGKFICIAESRDGVVEKSIVIQKPSKPIIERVIRPRNDEFNATLIWKTYSSNPIINCLIFDVVENEHLPQPLPLSILKDGYDQYSILYQAFVPFDGVYAFKITCQNTAGWSEKSDVFELTDDPIYIEIQKLYRHDSIVALDCVLIYNESKISLFWEKDEKVSRQEYSDTENYVEFTNRSVTLIFKDNEISNSGKYVCIARSNYGVATRYIYLNPPAEPINLEGSRANIQWRVHSVYPIIECKMQYGKIFGPLDNLERRVNIRRNEFDSYIISYLPPNILRGMYEFIISCRNEDGWSTRSKIQARQLRAVPLMRIDKTYSQGKQLTDLNCVVLAHPLANIIWKKDDEILNSSYAAHKTKNSVKISFNNVVDTDFGIYTCIAKNFLGSTRKEVIFKRPLRPIFKELISSEKDVIIWTVSSHEPLKYCYVYYNIENEERKFIADTQITLQENVYVVLHTPLLPYDGTYRFKVKCFSGSGWSDESEEKSLTIRDKGRDVASHTDSRISGGLQLAPSLIVLLITMILTNP